MNPTIDDRSFQIFTKGAYTPPQGKPLTDYQALVYKLIKQRYTNRRIADKLNTTAERIAVCVLEIKAKGWQTVF